MEFYLFQSYQMPLSHEVTFCERDFSLEITGCIRIHGRESEFLVRDQDLRGRIYHWTLQSNNSGGDCGSTFGFIQNAPLLCIFYDPSSCRASCSRKCQSIKKARSYFNFSIRDFGNSVRWKQTSKRVRIFLCPPWKTTHI